MPDPKFTLTMTLGQATVTFATESGDVSDEDVGKLAAELYEALFRFNNPE